LITGTGVDIIEISRIRSAMNNWSSFAARVFTGAEQDYCRSAACSDQRFAGRFAAKEAIAKALGTSLSWTDVEILPGESGKPCVHLHNKAAEVAAGRSVMVSISHCRSYAVAHAIVESRDSAWVS